MQNGLVLEGDTVWMKRALGVRRDTPSLVKQMLKDGATGPLARTRPTRH